MFKYDSTEIALKTLVLLHGVEIDGRKLSVTFSKERLWINMINKKMYNIIVMNEGFMK